jgi:hypothetical protein
MTKARQLLTQSRLKEFHRCERRHFLNYVLGIDTHEEDKSALNFGTAFHAGLEHWWLHNGISGFRRAMELAISSPGSFTGYELAKIKALMIGYDAVYGGNDGLITLEVEKEFCLPLRNPATNCSSRTFKIAGKIDAIARDLNGELWVVEHKTTSSSLDSESVYWSRLTMDEQISMYVYAAREIGFDVAGCIYDVIKKPVQRPYKATPESKRKYKKDGSLYSAQREDDETAKEYFIRIAEIISGAPSDFFRRTTVVRLDDEIAAFQIHLWKMAQRMISGKADGYHPKNPSACFDYNAECKYFPLCSGASTLGDSRWIKKAKINPELEQSNEPENAETQEN